MDGPFLQFSRVYLKNDTEKNVYTVTQVRAHEHRPCEATMTRSTLVMNSYELGHKVAV